MMLLLKKLENGSEKQAVVGTNTLRSFTTWLWRRSWRRISRRNYRDKNFALILKKQGLFLKNHLGMIWTVLRNLINYWAVCLKRTRSTASIIISAKKQCRIF